MPRFYHIAASKMQTQAAYTLPEIGILPLCVPPRPQRFTCSISARARGAVCCVTMHYDRPNPHAAGLDELAGRFRRFATTEVEETSPLYYALALAVAGDRDLLRLAAEAQPGQPPANMLLGAVHLLMLRETDHPLAGFFPDLTDSPAPPAAAAPTLRAFCLERRDVITAILRTRLVQTNELRRCAYLLPAFSHVAGMARAPLALVEVGASAGLNLLFDRYAYRYQLDGMALRAGDPASPVLIDTVCTEHDGAELPLGMPAIEQRAGIDLNPVDLAADDAYDWLRALIWPEHGDRAARLEAARRLWLAQPPDLVCGDAVEQLPAVLDALPESVAPVVFHTHVLNQFAPAAAAALEALIVDLSARRTIYRIGNDLGGGTPKQYVLRLRTYRRGIMHETILAHTDGHARLIEWLASP